MSPRLLIIDDDTSHLASLIKIFNKMTLDVVGVPRGKEALALIAKQNFTIVLSDLMLPDIDGLDLLIEVKKYNPRIEIVIMTAYGTIERAVEAMRRGAYDFITKPFRRAEIERVIQRALERVSLIQENQELKKQLAEARIAAATNQSGVIGHAPAFRKVLELAFQAAPSQATILLQGESGTGKEIFAQTIHTQSSRANEPFVTVNCGALPEGIIEAELFGVEKGAFTGATHKRDGRFSRAHGGTLFLDEIGEMPLHLQVKLLRVLQSGEYESVGGSTPLFSDCRVIAATNVNLLEAVREGDFREDLYYRLKVISLTLPPLRERRDDIPLLAEHFLQRFINRHQRPIKSISSNSMNLLITYPWPGNVRELENTIERAVVLCQNDQIEPLDLPAEIHDQSSPIQPQKDGLDVTPDHALFSVPLGTPLQEVERRLIMKTLAFTSGDKRQTAQLLGIATRTIYRKLAHIEEDS
jgi:two-component system, NtrC family, response regulator HydG